jgi:hypothetical protein
MLITRQNNNNNNNNNKISALAHYCMKRECKTNIFSHKVICPVTKDQRKTFASAIYSYQSRWPRGLRRGSAAVRLLGLWVPVPPGHRCLAVVMVACCQVEVSASGWSLVQRSSTKCRVSECDPEASMMTSPWPTRGCCTIGKKKKEDICNCVDCYFYYTQCCLKFPVLYAQLRFLEFLHRNN